MNKGQILEWLDKNNRGFTQKDFELFEKFYKEATKELEAQIKELNYQKQARSIAENAVVDLTKENAELKEKLLQERETYWGKGFECAKKKYEQQLTKAKDFILKLTTYLEGHTNYDFEYELIKEVKQFLKESEVEK